MSLLFGQLVYTSFAKVGFKVLASSGVPINVQQAFIEQIVYQYWDAYNPPKLGYRAAYLYQVTSEQNLFGWLYNDGMDDLGRSHTPYFFCYYLPKLLDVSQVKSILTYLKKGPDKIIERQNPPTLLEEIVAPDLWNYKPARTGVTISVDIRDRVLTDLQQQKLIKLFIPFDPEEMLSELNYSRYQKQNLVAPQDLTQDSPNSTLLDLKDPNINLKNAQYLTSSSLNQIQPEPLNLANNHDENSASQEVKKLPIAKIALLIGVTEYGLGFNSLPSAQADVKAMQKILQNPELGNFDEVITLIDPDRQVMEEAIENLFSSSYQQEQAALLYFSGYGIRDENGKLYFATSITRKNAQEKLVKSSVVSASFVQEIMDASPSQHQIVILDCPWFNEDFTDKSLKKIDISADVRTQLGWEKRVILTSSTSTCNTFDPNELDLSIYTRYLVEGMATGAADLDNNGVISVGNLHAYATRKVQQAMPINQPEIYGLSNYQQFILAEVSLDDPKRKYRQEVERYNIDGEISIFNRSILAVLRDNLGLLPEDAAAIENEVLEPYRQYQINLQRYAQEFVRASNHPDLCNDTRQRLRSLQIMLSIRDDDVQRIEDQLLQQLKSISYLGNQNDTNKTPITNHQPAKPKETIENIDIDMEEEATIIIERPDLNSDERSDNLLDKIKNYFNKR